MHAVAAHRGPIRDVAQRGRRFDEEERAPGIQRDQAGSRDAGERSHTTCCNVIVMR